MIALPTFAILSWGITAVVLVLLNSKCKEVDTLNYQLGLLKMDTRYHKLRVKLAIKRNQKATRELMHLRAFKRRFTALIQRAYHRKKNQQ